PSSACIQNCARFGANCADTSKPTSIRGGRSIIRRCSHVHASPSQGKYPGPRVPTSPDLVAADSQLVGDGQIPAPPLASPGAPRRGRVLAYLLPEFFSGFS